jgi:hypothetical protein
MSPKEYQSLTLIQFKALLETLDLEKVEDQ